MGRCLQEGRDLSGVCYLYLLMFQQEGKAFFQASFSSGRTKNKTKQKPEEMNVESRPNQEQRCTRTSLGERRRKSTSLKSTNSY